MIKSKLHIFLILFLLSVTSYRFPVLSSFLFTNDCSKSNNAYSTVAVCDGDTIIIGPETSDLRPENKNDLCSHETDLKKISALMPQHSQLFKVRLIGIDSFEIGQNEYGKKAKEYLTKVLLNKSVCIETDAQEKDKYDRTLGYVFLESCKVSKLQSFKDQSNIEPRPCNLKTMEPCNLFVNEEILKSGLAILYNFPPNTKYIDRLKKAQIYARENMIGIWKKQDYIKETPYQFRNRKNKSDKILKR